MDKRRAPRIDADRTVRLTTLGEQSDQRTARIVNISGGGMRLLVDRPLAAGLPLQVEWDDILLLGDVSYCQPQEEGFAIGLHLEHALLHTRELANFSRALLGAVEAAQSDRSQPAPVRKRPD